MWSCNKAKVCFTRKLRITEGDGFSRLHGFWLPVLALSVSALFSGFSKEVAWIISSSRSEYTFHGICK